MSIKVSSKVILPQICNMMISLPSMDLSDMYTTMGIILSMYEERLSTRITLDYNAQALDCS